MAHLLVVDDNDEIVEALGEFLRDEGHQVDSASSGDTGLRILRASPLPDALVLDVDMPFLNGPAMAHQMLLHDAGEEKVPVILMSGRDNLSEIAGEMGTAYFIKKPPSPEGFLLLLNRALRERRGPTSA